MEQTKRKYFLYEIINLNRRVYDSFFINSYVEIEISLSYYQRPIYIVFI